MHPSGPHRSPPPPGSGAVTRSRSVRVRVGSVGWSTRAHAAISYNNKPRAPRAKWPRRVRHHRGSAYGVVITQLPLPVTSTSLTDPPFRPLALRSPELVKDLEHATPHAVHASWSLPKLDFPSFDGDNPQFWKTRCEKYFEVYSVPSELWVWVATLHFTGNAARWL